MVNPFEDDRLPLFAQDRALRLRREAINCIEVALETHDTCFAADLINEAARLAIRAREISTGA